MNFNPYPSLCIELHWAKNLNIRPDILNLLKEEAQNSCELIGAEMAFLKTKDDTRTHWFKK